MAVVDGQPLNDRITRASGPIAAGLTVMADAEDKDRDLGLPTIADLTGGWGPLAGLQTALAHAWPDEGKQKQLLAPCELVTVRLP